MLVAPEPLARERRQCVDSRLGRTEHPAVHADDSSRFEVAPDVSSQLLRQAPFAIETSLERPPQRFGVIPRGKLGEDPASNACGRLRVAEYSGERVRGPSLPPVPPPGNQEPKPR